ncbi:hypothetical protein [Moraxella catarrhalis]|uniref:hypothetical protein n=1 Tax=Moraxella catarrhalis TaxID=480 RepID=UPI000EA950F2|nr:hypothetical protein [Moraxella catarrhalis]MPW68378.1 hypothetical protein [Moraxella catarrhalis]MPX57070.1 hypothetical protein [Moraxella catarrhalis]RKL81343.1 hypothetical protein D6D63_06645 [Moraxella catarrhalis]
MLKKLMLSAVLATGLAIVSTGALAANKEGDLCFSYDSSLNAKFICANTFDGKQIAINEIYNKGYRIVSMQKTPHNLLIVIEEQ